MAYFVTGLVCLLVGVLGGGVLSYLYADKVVAYALKQYHAAQTVVAEVKKVV